MTTSPLKTPPSCKISNIQQTLPLAESSLLLMCMQSAVNIPSTLAWQGPLLEIWKQHCGSSVQKTGNIRKYPGHNTHFHFQKSGLAGGGSRAGGHNCRWVKKACLWFWNRRSGTHMPGLRMVVLLECADPPLNNHHSWQPTL